MGLRFCRQSQVLFLFAIRSLAYADGVPVALISSSTGRLVRVLESLNKHASGISDLHVIFDLQNPYQRDVLVEIARVQRNFVYQPFRLHVHEAVSQTDLFSFVCARLAGGDSKIKTVVLADSFALEQQFDFSGAASDGGGNRLICTSPNRGGAYSVVGIVLDGAGRAKFASAVENGAITSNDGEGFQAIFGWFYENNLISVASCLKLGAFRSLENEPEIISQRVNHVVYDLAAHYLPVDPVVVEAGAFCGDDTRMLSRIWPTGYIHAFEPNPEIFDWLCKSTRDLPNVSRYMLALTNKSGTGEFNPVSKGDGGVYGMGSLLKFGPVHSHWYIGFHPGSPVQVKLETISGWAEANGITKTDFMWLDMEGGELAALSASPAFVKKASVIYTEVTRVPGLREKQPLYEEVKAYLEGLGFVEVAKDFFDINGSASGCVWDGNCVFVRRDVLLNKGRSLVLGARSDVPTIRIES